MSGVLLRHIRRLAAHQSGLPDRELLRRFTLRRDDDAFATLVGRHGAMVLGVCRAVLGRHEDAEDVFQATFLVLAQKAGSIRKRESLAGWLHGVALRLARKLGAKSIRQPVCQPADLDQVQARPMDDLTWRELRAVLHEELGRLPERFRLPLLLCHLEGQTQDEAARRLGWTLGELRGRLLRGRELLRARLLKRGLAPAVPLLATVLSAGEAAALPALLAEQTVRSAVLSLAGGVGVTVSARATGLAAEGVRSMFLTKLKIAAALCLCVGLLGAGAGVLAVQSPAAKPPVPREAAEEQSPEGKQEQQRRTDRFGDPLPAGAALRLGTLRFRHDNWVRLAAVSPDGKVIAGGGGRWVRLWDAVTGKELRRIDLPLGSESAIAFSPDGKTLAIGGHDCVVRLWDAATGKLLRQCVGHQPPKRDPKNMRVWFHIASGIFQIAFSSDGKTLASLGSDGTIRLWESATAKQLHQLDGRIVNKIAFAPDGKTLIAAGGAGDSPGVVIVLDAATGKELRRWQTPAAVASLAVAPDGKTIATGLSGPKKHAGIVLWDAATGKERRRLLPDHKGPVVSVAFSSDGKTLVSATPYPDFALHLWDVASGKELRKIAAPASSFGVAFLDDDKVLLSWGSANTVHFWDARTGKPLRRFAGHEASVYDLAFSPDGKFVATAGGSEGAVRLWDAASGKAVALLSENNSRVNVTDVAFSPDGKLLAVARADGSIRLWRPATKKLIRRLDVGRGWIKTLAFSPDGKLLASAGENKTIRLWDVASGKEIRQWQGGRAIYRVAFSPDGKMLALADGAGKKNLRFWDVASGKEIDPVHQTDRSGVTDVAFSPDGRMLAAALMSDTIRLWELATGRERLVIKHPGPVTAIAFSRDGRLLASANNGNTVGTSVDNKDRELVRVWDVLTGKEIHRFTGHRGGILSLAFSPDGRLLASGSHDTTALLWDVRAIPKTKAAAQLTRQELQDLWTDLAGADTAQAYRALGKLVADPARSVPFLKKRLHPVKAADPKRVAELLAALDSDRFAARREATRALEKLGAAVEPALRKALKGQPGAEARRRVERLLGKLEAPPLLFGRAVEALEHIGNPEARQVLEALAEGVPEARLTREAKAALRRRTGG